MARSGIYKAEVLRARDNLLAIGRYPSIDAVRAELGNTGSKGTIHRLLKEIEEEEGGVAGHKVAVSEAIQDLAGRLAERLHEEADQRIDALTVHHKGELAGLNSVIEALNTEVSGFKSQTENLSLALATEHEAHTLCQAALQKGELTRVQMETRTQGLEVQLAEAEVHRQSLEDKHRHSREALEHFRQAAKDQREQEQRQFEQQIQLLHGELRSTKETAAAKQEELLHSHEKNARTSSDLIHAQQEVLRLRLDIEQLRSIKEQLQVLEQKNQHLAEKLAKTEQQIEHQLQINHLLSNKLEEAQSALKLRENELIATKAVLSNQAQLLDKLTSSRRKRAVKADEHQVAEPNQG